MQYKVNKVWIKKDDKDKLTEQILTRINVTNMI